MTHFSCRLTAATVQILADKNIFAKTTVHQFGIAIETVIIHRHINLLFFISLQGPVDVAAASSLFPSATRLLLRSATRWVPIANAAAAAGDGADSTTKHMHADRWVFWRNISTIISILISSSTATRCAQVGLGGRAVCLSQRTLSTINITIIIIIIIMIIKSLW